MDFTNSRPIINKDCQVECDKGGIFPHKIVILWDEMIIPSFENYPASLMRRD